MAVKGRIKVNEIVEEWPLSVVTVKGTSSHLPKSAKEKNKGHHPPPTTSKSQDFPTLKSQLSTQKRSEPPLVGGGG